MHLFIPSHYSDISIFYVWQPVLDMKFHIGFNNGFCDVHSTLQKLSDADIWTILHLETSLNSFKSFNLNTIKTSFLTQEKQPVVGSCQIPSQTFAEQESSNPVSQIPNGFSPKHP